MTEPFYNTGPNPSEQNPLDDPDLFADPDPLLESGWFIDPETAAEPMPDPEPEATESETTATTAAGAASPIMATPVSQRRPKRQVEETSEHPDWLPKEWRMEVRVRSSGATAGTADRYFISPSGQRFRSKVEVLHYLETGSKRKIGSKSKTDSEATPSKSPLDQKKKKSKSNPRENKSRSNPRDFSDLKFDFENPPQSVTWARAGAGDSPDDWVPSIGSTPLPESIKTEWGTTYARVTRLDKSKGAS